MIRRAISVLACAFAFSALSVAAQELVPRVRLGPSPAGIGETVVLVIEVQGAPTQDYFDASFRLENLRQVSGPSSAASVQIIQGRTSSSRTLTWRLAPEGIGPARVYGIEVQVGDRSLEAGEARIEIQQEIPPERLRRGQGRGRGRGRSIADQLRQDDPFDRFFRSRRPTPRSEPRIFLLAEVTPERPWVGQQMLYTLYLYTQADVVSVDPDKLPDFQGFWVREIPEPEDQRAQVEMIDHEGERFGRVRLLRRALFPRREGTFEIEPTRIALRARLPDEGPFGMLRARSVDTERTGNAITVDVQPLPEPPAGYQGAVGVLQLEGSLEPAELEVGDAATLTLTLRGSGHLQGVPEPRIPEQDGIKVFPPQQQARERVRGTRVTGSRTWQYVLVPEKPGSWELPPIVVPYFDPNRGAYDAATVDGLSLTARGGTELTQQDGNTVRLHPIRTAALPAAERDVGLGRLASGLFTVPWLLALGWIVLQKRSGSGKRVDRKTLAMGLDTADKHDDPRRAAAAIEDAWRDYLAARFGIAAGVASTQWQKELVRHGVSESRAGELVTLADDLHYLRYAPKLSSTEDLRRELIDRSRKLMRAL